jgi:hypothetical protein
MNALFSLMLRSVGAFGAACCLAVVLVWRVLLAVCAGAFFPGLEALARVECFVFFVAVVEATDCSGLAVAEDVAAALPSGPPNAQIRQESSNVRRKLFR